MCSACKIEVDQHVKQVAPDEPPIGTGAFLRVLIPAILAPVLVLIVSYFAFNWGKELILHRAMAAEVATEPMPIARRPAPIANTIDAGGKKFIPGSFLPTCDGPLKTYAYFSNRNCKADYF